MNILSWLRRRIEIWKFKHRIGRVVRRFSQLNQQTERAAFMMEHFGREGLKLLRSYSKGEVIRAFDQNQLFDEEMPASGADQGNYKTPC